MRPSITLLVPARHPRAGRPDTLRTKTLIAGWFLLTLLLAGCATTQPTATTTATTSPTMQPPAAPPPLPAPTPLPASEAPPAQLTGSEESSAMLDNFTAFVTAVDGVPVAAGRDGWNTPVPLKAGLRRVSVGFARGVFAAQAELAFTARSAAGYRLKFATDAQFLGKNTYCEFWIEDTATGETATDRKRVPLTKVDPAK